MRHCRIGYDKSGAFRIAAQPEGVLVTVVERLEMPGPDAGGRSSYLYLSPDNAENHAFLLQPADGESLQVAAARLCFFESMASGCTSSS